MTRDMSLSDLNAGGNSACQTTASKCSGTPPTPKYQPVVVIVLIWSTGTKAKGCSVGNGMVVVTSSSSLSCMSHHSNVLVVGGEGGHVSAGGCVTCPVARHVLDFVRFDYVALNFLLQFICLLWERCKKTGGQRVQSC